MFNGHFKSKNSSDIMFLLYLKPISLELQTSPILIKALKWNKLSCPRVQQKDPFTLHFIFRLTQLTSLRQSKCSLNNASTTGTICSQKLSSDTLLILKNFRRLISNMNYSLFLSLTLEQQVFDSPILSHYNRFLSDFCHSKTDFHPYQFQNSGYMEEYILQYLVLCPLSVEYTQLSIL